MSEVRKNEIKKKRMFLSVIKKIVLTSVTRKRGNIFGGGGEGDVWFSFYPSQKGLGPFTARVLRGYESFGYKF